MESKPTFADPEAQAAFEKLELRRLKFFQAIEQQRRHRKLLEKRTPCDTDMEMEVLATLIVFWGSKELAPAFGLHRRDFFLEENATLFEALTQARRDNIPANVEPAFNNWLKETGWWKKLAAAGRFESGTETLAWLAGVIRPRALVTTHVGYYCGVLRKHRILRAWKAVIEEIAVAISKPEATAESLAALATERFGQLKKLETLRTV